MQPILVLTDHKAIESWAKEVLDTPSGPVGRRARWHQIFSKYDLSVGYIPGRDNTVADILSRWAYPASQALRDISKHGSYADDQEMRDLIAQEKNEEQNCLYIHIKNPKKSAYVITRSGRGTAPGVDLPAADPPVATRTRSRHPSQCKRDSSEVLPSENLPTLSGGQSSGFFPVN